MIKKYYLFDNGGYIWDDFHKVIVGVYVSFDTTN